jgi:phenylalanine-4-hydroxylase
MAVAPVLVEPSFADYLTQYGHGLHMVWVLPSGEKRAEEIFSNEWKVLS